MHNREKDIEGRVIHQTEREREGENEKEGEEKDSQKSAGRDRKKRPREPGAKFAFLTWPAFFHV